ncbi:DNA-binding HORMA [Penicillium robsamsonii]|uniref:DNA-binding HORMA n=1 Tax=Penicillium robsamsonii TaxID=1792511 RepID=UPI002547FE59|nr:DNA-binding HORMA [Penicillium robsamsonii]KAJ5823574.1 DNA-binding HORMA [Penicillium robsamsonii]
MRNMIFEGKALRRLSTMCAEIPALPDERSLGIHIFYKLECPASYDIPGLTGSQDDTIEYPRTSYWKRTRRFYGSVDSGFHSYIHLSCSGLTPRSVGLRVNSLLSTSPGGEAQWKEANFDAVLRSDEVGIPMPARHQGIGKRQARETRRYVNPA